MKLDDKNFNSFLWSSMKVLQTFLYVAFFSACFLYVWSPMTHVGVPMTHIGVPIEPLSTLVYKYCCLSQQYLCNFFKENILLLIRQLSYIYHRLAIEVIKHDGWWGRTKANKKQSKNPSSPEANWQMLNSLWWFIG